MKSILSALQKNFDAQPQEYQGLHSVILEAEHLMACSIALKETHGFEMLNGLSAVDYWPETEPRFHVVYQFLSITKNLRLEVRVPLVGNTPSIDSLTEVYASANWFERELWDMFGIKARNHPDLRRILMPADWEGHPLRKDYPLDYEEVQFSFNFEEIDQRKPRPSE